MLSCTPWEEGSGGSVTYAARMHSVPGTARMSLRIRLLEKFGDGEFERVSAEGLGVWRKSRAEARRVPLRAARSRTSPRRRLSRARPLSLARRRRRADPSGAAAVGALRQGGGLPNLRVASIQTRQGEVEETAVYKVKIVNDGLAEAHNVGVLLRVDGEIVDESEVIEVLEPNEDADGHLQRSRLPAAYARDRRSRSSSSTSPASETTCWVRPVSSIRAVSEPQPQVEADGRISAQRDAPVGGQAVLEGVMMRGISTWAVAVRKPSAAQVEAVKAGERIDVPEGEIEIVSEPLVSWTKRHRVYRLPIIRGVVALGESLKIGFKALGISANAQLTEDEKGEQQEIGGAAWAGTIAFSLLLAVGLFFLLPAGLTNIFKDEIPNSFVFVVIEKLIRISIFLGYLWLISRMRDLQRVFEYHGAEHKTISCYEAGLDLTPENAQQLLAPASRAAGPASC